MIDKDFYQELSENQPELKTPSGLGRQVLETARSREHFWNCFHGVVLSTLALFITYSLFGDMLVFRINPQAFAYQLANLSENLNSMPSLQLDLTWPVILTGMILGALISTVMQFGEYFKYGRMHLFSL